MGRKRSRSRLKGWKGHEPWLKIMEFEAPFPSCWEGISYDKVKNAGQDQELRQGKGK